MSAAAAGVGLMALGMVTGGINAGNQAEFQAEQMREQAKRVEAQALQRQRQLITARGRHLGKQVAQVAASGVTMEGSPLDAIAESEANFSLDAANIERNASARAANLRVGARGQQARGTAAITGSVLGATGTVLMGME